MAGLGPPLNGTAIKKNNFFAASLTLMSCWIAEIWNAGIKTTISDQIFKKLLCSNFHNNDFDFLQ